MFIIFIIDIKVANTQRLNPVLMIMVGAQDSFTLFKLKCNFVADK